MKEKTDDLNKYLDYKTSFLAEDQEARREFLSFYKEEEVEILEEIIFYCKELSPDILMKTMIEILEGTQWEKESAKEIIEIMNMTVFEIFHNQKALSRIAKFQDGIDSGRGAKVRGIITSAKWLQSSMDEIFKGLDKNHWDSVKFLEETLIRPSEK